MSDDTAHVPAPQERAEDALKRLHLVDDELPPMLGEKFRDITHDIARGLRARRFDHADR